MMQVIDSIGAWRALRKTMDKDKSLGFVATMGNLHEGHESLLNRCKTENDISVLSIFVNPTQFNEKQDYEHYPKTLEADLAMAKPYVDYVLLPTVNEIYPDNYHFKITEDNISTLLEGKFRPGHFNGMLTIVMKLFMLIKPHRAYFGEKDFQQLKLIEAMVNAFFLDIEVIACKTVRHHRRLALSSRNSRLTEQEFAKALMLPKLMEQCVDTAQTIKLLQAIGFEVDYLEKWQGRLLAAVKLGDVRLIDNIDLNLEMN